MVKLAMNRRRAERSPADFDGPKDFSDNAVGRMAYIHLEGEAKGEEAPLTGLLNEVNKVGCSVIVDEDAKGPLTIGVGCYLRLASDEQCRAVVRWVKPFGDKTVRVGFELDRG